LVFEREAAPLFALMFNGCRMPKYNGGTFGWAPSAPLRCSIVVALIWVYYTAQILLLGAEFTNVRAR
jgi:hypothetical protein